MALPIGQLGTSEPRPTLLLARDIEAIMGASRDRCLRRAPVRAPGFPVAGTDRVLAGPAIAQRGDMAGPGS